VWESVSPFPTPCAGSPIWTGSVVVTACPHAGGAGLGIGDQALYRLDPEDGSWSQATNPPIDLEGSPGAPALARLGDFVVVVGQRSGSAVAEPVALGYDPDADAWRELPGGPVPLAPDELRPGGQTGLAIASVPGGLLVVSADRTSARYDLDQQQWEELPDIPLPGSICPASLVVADETPVVDLCDGVAALGPDGSWTTTSYDGEPFRLEGGAWSTDGTTAAMTTGSGIATYRPPPADEDGQIPFASPVPLPAGMQLDVPDGARVTALRIVVPESTPLEEGGLGYEEQLEATVVLADGAECTVTTGSPFHGAERGVGVQVHGLDAGLAPGPDGQTVRWSWEPDLVGFQEQQVACPTDEQALALAEHVVRAPEPSGVVPSNAVVEGPNGG
jgi:hypothetical protein